MWTSAKGPRLTWNNEVNGGQGIPAEAHRVAQHRLRLGALQAEVPAVAGQNVDVVRQTQRLAVGVPQLQIQKVAAGLEAVNTPHHINDPDQRKHPTGRTGNNNDEDSI